MTEIQERRAEGAGRVRGRNPGRSLRKRAGNSAFEAEAVDVSARGMQFAHRLPARQRRAPGLPLRSGPAARSWSKAAWPGAARGQPRRRVRGRIHRARQRQRGRPARAVRRRERATRSPGSAPRRQSEIGSRVRLHIEGLGSPMKARVRESGSQNVQVGSISNFSRSGANSRSKIWKRADAVQAQIDGVSVAIDPQTRIPAIGRAAALRRRRRHHARTERDRASLRRKRSPRASKSRPSSVTTNAVAPARANDAQHSDSDQDDGDQDDADAAALRGKIGEAAANAGEAVQTAGAARGPFSRPRGPKAWVAYSKAPASRCSSSPSAPNPRRNAAPPLPHPTATEGSKVSACARSPPQMSARRRRPAPPSKCRARN